MTVTVTVTTVAMDFSERDRRVRAEVEEARRDFSSVIYLGPWATK